MGLVSLQDLTLNWGTQPVLKRLDLTLEAGERLAIIGSNGSGKSSLGQLIAGWHGAGLHRGGNVRIEAIDPITLTPAQRAVLVHYVGQTPMHQLSGRCFSVSDEIAFGPENLLLPREEISARLVDLIAKLGLTALVDRDPFTLSGGEQQRLSIAAALALQPKLLVLDEPAGNLDSEARQELASVLQSLPADTTVLLLDVDARLAQALGFRQLFLKEGRLQPVDLSIEEPVPAVRSPIARIRAGAAPSLEIQALSFAFPGGKPLFSGLDLSVLPGEAVALVGRNGAGKSTLFRLINGILHPTSGRVVISGENSRGKRIDEIAGRVGTVFQEPENQLFAATVRQEVAFGVEQLKLPGTEQSHRIDTALARTGLGDVAHRHPLDLDAARRRFVAIASVLARQPEILLLDEPQRGLDAANKQRLAGIIADEQTKGTAVLFICHEPAFVAQCASRSVSLNNERGEGV